MKNMALRWQTKTFLGAAAWRVGTLWTCLAYPGKLLSSLWKFITYPELETPIAAK